MTARTPRTSAASSQLIAAESLQALSDTEFAAVQERIAAEESRRLAATCLRPPSPALFLTGVIRGIDIRDPPWPYPVQLDDGFLSDPRKVISVGLHDGDTPRRQRLGFCLVERIAGSNDEGARQHGDTLRGGMRVGGDLIVGGELGPEGKGHRLA